MLEMRYWTPQAGADNHSQDPQWEPAALACQDHRGCSQRAAGRCHAHPGKGGSNCPVRTGDVILPNILDTGIDVTASRDMKRAEDAF